MTTLGAVCLCLTFSFLESPPIADSGQYTMLILYLLLYGFGRSLWETTNKTVLSFHIKYFSKLYIHYLNFLFVFALFQQILTEYFQEKPDFSSGGLSLVSFVTGISSTMGFFSFLYFQTSTVAKIILAFSIFSIFCHLVSTYYTISILG